MVDKGFLIESECTNNNNKLIRPVFLKNKSQFSTQESELNLSIAEACVHVERAIQRIKSFNILTSTFEWKLAPYLDNILLIIAGIVNLSSPILSDERF